MELYQLNQGKIPYLSFPVLETIPWIRHGFSTRLGGVSTGIHRSMNLGFQNGDEKENVYENYARICDVIGVKPESIVHAKQTHLDQYRIVDYDDIGKGYNRERDYDDIDALVTNHSGITLTILTADCVPVYLVDPENKAIGLVHSGWSGTVKRIAAKTVQGMMSAYGTKPAQVIAVTGPCICADCFEVGDEVADAFLNEFGSNRFSLITHKVDERYHINLAESIAQSLLDIGLNSSNIHQSGLCTACNPDLLFSHRVTQGKRGTMAAFLSINE